MIELTWGADNDTIRQLREDATRGRFAIAGFDPGDHGALAIKHPDRSIEVFTIGDERRGTWETAARGAALAKVSVFVCETQHAPRSRPGVSPFVVTSQAASAMRVARCAGLLLGKVSGLLDASHQISVVYTQPATWQRWSLELPGRYKSARAKEASIEHANSKIPMIMDAISRAKDREGAADALGLLTWYLTSPLR